MEWEDEQIRGIGFLGEGDFGFALENQCLGYLESRK